MFIWITLIIRALSQQTYLHEPFNSSLRIRSVRPITIEGDNDFYLLYQETSSVIIRKLTNQLQTVWTYTLTGQNNYTGIDLKLGSSSLYVVVNLNYTIASEIPALIPSINPKTLTFQSLLLTFNMITGSIASSQWIGGCYDNNSWVNEIRYDGLDLYGVGTDDCNSGRTWVAKLGKWQKFYPGKTGFVQVSLDGSFLNIAMGVNTNSKTRICKLDKYMNSYWETILGNKPPNDIIAFTNAGVDYSVIVMDNELDLLGPNSAVLESISLSNVNFVGIEMSSVSGFIVSGIAMNGAMGTSIGAQQAGIIIWLSSSLDVLSYRIYDSGNSVNILKLIPLSFKNTAILLRSSETFYSNIYSRTDTSALLILSSNPFAYKTCSSLCDDCFGSTADKCYSCKYYSNSQYSCGACNENCNTCNGSSSKSCLTCAQGYIFTNNFCVLDLNCISGTYPDNESKTCKACDDSCGLCTSGSLTDCITCAASYVRNDLLCVNQCPSFRYNDSGICKDCNSDCETCIGQSNSQCTRCKMGKMVYKGSCLISCPVNTYTTSFECLDCNQACDGCTTGGISSCVSCSLGHFAFNDMCLNTCPAGYYSFNSTCASCSENCINCSSQECNHCDYGYFLESGACYPGSWCPDTTYFNGTHCNICHENCESCYGESAYDCFSCNSHLFLRNSSCMELISTCKSNQYKDDNNTCIDCPFNCAQCSHQTCLICESNKVMFENECVGTCPEYYNNITGVCVRCPDRCAICDRGKCTKCLMNEKSNGWYHLEAGLCSEKITCAPSYSYSYSKNYCIYNDQSEVERRKVLILGSLEVWKTMKNN